MYISILYINLYIYKNSRPKKIFHNTTVWCEFSLNSKDGDLVVSFLEVFR